MFAIEQSGTVTKLLDEKKQPPTYATVHRWATRIQPVVSVMHLTQNRLTGQSTRTFGDAVVQPSDDEEILFMEARMDLKEVAQFHVGVHGGLADVSEVRLSVDGVQEANANKVSLNVLSIQFPGCRNIYPVCIQRPARGTDKEEARRALEDLVVDLK